MPLFTGLAVDLYAVDGVVLIDQNRALAGNITPGDAPGFPITISVPGSYRLTGNLTLPDANTDGIDITASNVTLDLNGFSILGPVVCVGAPVTSCSPTGTGNGVDGSGANDITVLNGVVRGMGNNGIRLGNSIGIDGHHLERVHAKFNGFTGILVSNGTVSGCTSNYNGFVGINVNKATVSGNTANFNSNNGIVANCPSTVVGNTATSNAVNIFTAGAGCAVANIPQ